MKLFYRKALAAFLAVFSSGLIGLSAPTVSSASYRVGDTNSDGNIDMRDVINICKHSMKSPELTGENLETADYNKDGKVNITDALFLSRLIINAKNLEKVVTLINIKRIQSGLEKLTYDQLLTDAAMKRASELPRNFSGDYRPDNTRFETVLTEYGIQYQECSNCIAAVPVTPEELYSAMVSNEGVLNRILSTKHKKIGVGYFTANDKYKHYWAILLV